MTRRIRAVIVDDMAIARERVARYLADEADIEIVGEAANGADAVCLIVGEGPDVAFLDVGLPDFDGFEIVRRLPSATRPVTIFLTAHGEKALEAFDVNAGDYLAKPFSRERFSRALNRAREQLRLHHSPPTRPVIISSAWPSREAARGRRRSSARRLHRRRWPLSVRSRRQGYSSHARPTHGYRGAARSCRIRALPPFGDRAN